MIRKVNDELVFVHLVQSVFGTKDGQDLLKKLQDRFVKGDLFNKDPLVTAHRLGKRDIIELLQISLEITDNELEEVPHSQDSLFND